MSRRSAPAWKLGPLPGADGDTPFRYVTRALLRPHGRDVQRMCRPRSEIESMFLIAANLGPYRHTSLGRNTRLQSHSRAFTARDHGNEERAARLIPLALTHDGAYMAAANRDRTQEAPPVCAILDRKSVV